MRCDNVFDAEAHLYAGEVRDTLLDSPHDINADHRRDNPITQGFRVTLVLVLGVPAIVASATTLGHRLALYRQIAMTMKTANGVIIETNLTWEQRCSQVSRTPAYEKVKEEVSCFKRNRLHKQH